MKSPADILQRYNVPSESLVLPPVIVDDILYKDDVFKMIEENLPGEHYSTNLYSKVYHHVTEHPEPTPTGTDDRVSQDNRVHEIDNQ